MYCAILLFTFWRKKQWQILSNWFNIFTQFQQIVVIIKDWSGMNLKSPDNQSDPPPNMCFSLPGLVSSHLDHSEPRSAAFQLLLYSFQLDNVTEINILRWSHLYAATLSSSRSSALKERAFDINSAASAGMDVGLTIIAIWPFLLRILEIGRFKLQVSFVPDKNIWNAFSLSLTYLSASWLQAHEPANLPKTVQFNQKKDRMWWICWLRTNWMWLVRT